MPAQDLRIRRVAIDTWRESVVYLHRDCAAVRAAGFQALSKVMVRANGMAISAVLNVVDDVAIVQPDELGLSEDAFARLDVVAGHAAQVSPAEPPASLSALHRKIAGERLSRDDLHAIIRDVAQVRYSKIELAAFVVATNGYDLERDEVLYLSEVNAERQVSVGAIDNLRLARIARLAGAPQVSGAGVDLLRKVGDPVTAGQARYRMHARMHARIHARYPADLGFARDMATRDSGYSLTLSSAPA